MTSRLKHKLELENINLKSAYLNESFVQIGTPLPALADNKKDKLEYLPEWQQEVRDEKGRRRFHGAFTGGFSAGYYNSVGSKEGWAPSSFKSSRNNRASKVQRAEDFMDEEDLEALKDDRKLENTDTFKDAGFAGMREGMSDGKADVLESLIAPARSSIGQTLLQKQGWRPGQGIGPRVTARKLKWQEAKMGLGLAGPSRLRDEDEDMDGGEAGKHTFAPRDTKLVVYQAKDDREGLGFQKGMGMGTLPQSRKAGPSFGVGYVNDDDDDDDPYGTTGASSSSLAFAFDNATEQNDDVIVMGELAKPADRSQAGTSRKPGSTDTWHDGRPMLQGFVLDPLGVPTDKWFEMPDIPDDWRPRPARVWGTTRQWDQLPGAVTEKKEVIRGAPGQPLTFEQRGDARGEEPRVSKAKSVFEYMSEKEKERLASILAAAKEGPPPAFLTTEETVKEEEGPGIPASEIEVPPLSPRTASSALRGYMPYNDDLEKQDRYRTYLTSQTYNTKEPNPTFKPGASFDAINKELDDFASSARIFKPMAFAMSSRFTSGSASLATSDLKQAKPGLHVYDATKAKIEAEKKAEPVPEVKKAMTPREQAADVGQYGRLTREVAEFYPVKLLCKRFGVADPHPEGKPEASNTGSNTPSNGLEGAPLPKNDASWASAFVHQSDEEKSSTPAVAEDSGERAPRTMAEVGMADDVNQGRDTLTYTKPSMDIFKAIFASDDEDSDDEPDEVDVKPTIPAPLITRQPSPPKRTEQPLAADDLSEFKPVYRKADAPGGDSDKKKKKDKKKRKGVLSFEVGDEGEEGEAVSQEERRKKRKEVAKPTLPVADVEDSVQEEEWVEKTGIPVARAAHRKGAADFM